MREWHLTAAQRGALERELVHTQDAAMYRRLLGLLQIDSGRSVSEVARELRVDRRSLQRWRKRFVCFRRPAALKDHRGQGRPPIWDESLSELLEAALDQPPFRMGYPANTWTVPVLQALLAVSFPDREVSTWTVRRHLRALGYAWKRFRYVLAPDPEAEKKTPDTAANTGPGPWHCTFGRGRNPRKRAKKGGQKTKKGVG
jgi:transposase